MKRVVTGHDSAGKAIVVGNGEPPTILEFPTLSGTRFFEIWKTGALPVALHDEPTDPTLGPIQMIPAKNGCAVRVVQIAPEGDGLTMSAEQIAEHFRNAGSPAATTGSSSTPHPLMHRTETIDFGILISGELTLILDDSEVVLQPGDIVVQNGTNHAWSNRSTAVCRIAFILLDGTYSKELRSSLESRMGH